ncbi:MAG TPA: glycosyltransferase [Verrucomicrobiae bacterium]|jgi:cellulose synthase/poly-beta-1,6-N-acetylglucosamine synthase-like glycosyltransferase|nr:glycosyltransferase [Verrucomicrobiae bacterium]
MTTPLPSASLRPMVSGKFFRVDGKKFYPKGVTYGPFAPNRAGEPFCEPEQTARDFDLIARLGANLLRVYYAPPRWALDLAQARGLKVLIDIPWSKHLCFLDSPALRRDACETVRTAVKACARHPAVFAYSVVNEISPDVARWSGGAAVAEFLDSLVDVAKEVDPECLCTFGNYPPTEFLRPENIDFLCFNVYLHQQRAFENYLARLQMIADDKPLLLGEIGIDSLREGEGSKSVMLDWQIESAFRGGVAGMVVYSFTDEWHRNGREVLDWQFGLTTRSREPKQSFAAVERKFGEAPHFALSRWPKISVVVACYNAARTLQPCLDSLRALHYPDYEVIVVDDGSTDITEQVTSLYPDFRCLRQTHQGLSVARNTGIAAAEGEIIAFTDADCRPDEDWLHYAVGDLLKSPYVGMGGHNFLPPDDSAVAAAVAVSPGGPAHVMLTDRQAEHIPGCNMIFYKWALEEIGGFDPIFHRAGDDVDVCWRLQQKGYKIGFSPPGFVWHYRRSTIGAYVAQQRGYGEAEAMLVRRHPEYFNVLGASAWQGRIYTPSKFGLTVRRPIIYHGIFATGFFQSVYQSQPAMAVMLWTSLEYHAVVNLPLLALSIPFRALAPLALMSVLTSLGVCVVAAAQAELPRSRRRWWSRPLVAMLFFLQPIVRGWARYQGRLSLGPTPPGASESLESLALQDSGSLDHVEYWAEQGMDRVTFVRRIIDTLEKQGWEIKVDAGWSDFDVEILGSRWAGLQLATVSEPHADGKQLLRCRLRTGWSLPAKIAIFSLLCFVFMVIGFVWRSFWQISFLLLTVPAFAWHVHRHERDLQRLICVLLDDIAEESGMTKLGKK